MNPGRALVAGAAGAATVTAANELGRRFLPNAPRLDLTGERALARWGGLRWKRATRPVRFRQGALAAAVLTDAAYYALVGRGSEDGRVRRGVTLGALAGLGALLLVPRLGLGARAVNATPATSVMTVAWYTLAGYVAGRVARALDDRDHVARLG